MNNLKRAERACWKIFADAVAETIGFSTPLHKAALKAHHGRDRDGKEFYAELDKLPVEEQTRLRDHLQNLDAKRDQVTRAYAYRGLV